MKKVSPFCLYNMNYSDCSSSSISNVWVVPLGSAALLGFCSVGIKSWLIHPWHLDRNQAQWWRYCCCRGCCTGIGFENSPFLLEEENNKCPLSLKSSLYEASPWFPTSFFWNASLLSILNGARNKDNRFSNLKHSTEHVTHLSSLPVSFWVPTMIPGCALGSVL